VPRRGEPVDTEGRLRETIGRYHGVVLDTNAFVALAKAFVDDICETPADNVVYAFLLEVKRMMGENFLLHSYEELRREYARRLEDLRDYDGRELCHACPILSKLLGPTVRGLCYLFRGHEDVSVHDVLSLPEYSEQLERLYRGLRRGYAGLPESLQGFRCNFKEGRAGDKHVDVANVMMAAVKGSVLVTSDRGIRDACSELKPGCLCVYFNPEYVDDPAREELEFELVPRPGGLPVGLRYRKGIGKFTC